VEICGGQTALASAIGLRQGNVWSWINRFGNKVPPEYVLSVAAATKWMLTPNELRPDIYPHPLDGLPENLRLTGTQNEIKAEA
jgi:DNA-binding transcriptional regulator YdaS (Cro superfamily)